MRCDCFLYVIIVVYFTYFEGLNRLGLRDEPALQPQHTQFYYITTIRSCIAISFVKANGCVGAAPKWLRTLEW